MLRIWRRRRRSQPPTASAKPRSLPASYPVLEPFSPAKVSYRQNSYRAVPAAGTVKRASRTAASAATKSLKTQKPGRRLAYKLTPQPGLAPVTRLVDALRCKPRPSPKVKTRGKGAARKPFVPWCR